MKNLFYYLLASFLLASCATDEKKEVKRVGDVSYSVITDSIYSSMPGAISAVDGNVYWYDAMGIAHFIHVVNVKSGKEICSFGNKGDGPDDFVMPVPSVSSSGAFFLNDTEKGMEHLYRVDGNGVASLEKRKYEKDMEVTKLTHLDDKTLVGLTPGAASLFKTVANGKVGTGGKFP